MVARHATRRPDTASSSPSSFAIRSPWSRTRLSRALMSAFRWVRSVRRLRNDVRISAASAIQVPTIAQTSGVMVCPPVSQPAFWYRTIRSRKPRTRRSRERYTRHLVEQVTAVRRFPHNGSPHATQLSAPIAGTWSAAITMSIWQRSQWRGGRRRPRPAVGIPAPHFSHLVTGSDLRRPDESVTEVSANVTHLAGGGQVQIRATSSRASAPIAVV